MSKAQRITVIFTTEKSTVQSCTVQQKAEKRFSQLSVTLRLGTTTETNTVEAFNCTYDTSHPCEFPKITQKSTPIVAHFTDPGMTLVRGCSAPFSLEHLVFLKNGSLKEGRL